MVFISGPPKQGMVGAAQGIVEAPHEQRHADELVVKAGDVPDVAVLHELLAVVAGGSERQDSVRRALEAVAAKLIAAAKEAGGRACGWRALEMIRIEAGLPRFGVDMDESNLAPEAGIEARAISYTKGCYLGQEVIARIHWRGQPAKRLRGLIIDTEKTPSPGTQLYAADGKKVGESRNQSVLCNSAILILVHEGARVGRTDDPSGYATPNQGGHCGVHRRPSRLSIRKDRYSS